MADEEMPYRGVIYVGLMLTTAGPKVVEFNCRFGDPEAQVILPRLKTDLVTAMLAVVEGGLGHFSMRWDERSAVTVVMAAKGYPGPYSKGSEIRGLKESGRHKDTLIFHAGTVIDRDDNVLANGGRVLAVTGLGADGASARQTAYDAIGCIDWPDGFFRTDIAKG
jgi:phosphoribosylamine--glycine ligase